MKKQVSKLGAGAQQQKDPFKTPVDKRYVNQMKDVNDVLEHVIKQAAIVCYDKEIEKKIKPFSLVYTMDILGLTFEQKTVKVDMRKDDYYI